MTVPWRYAHWAPPKGGNSRVMCALGATTEQWDASRLDGLNVVVLAGPRVQDRQEKKRGHRQRVRCPPVVLGLYPRNWSHIFGLPALVPETNLSFLTNSGDQKTTATSGVQRRANPLKRPREHTTRNSRQPRNPLKIYKHKSLELEDKRISASIGNEIRKGASSNIVCSGHVEQVSSTRPRVS